MKTLILIEGETDFNLIEPKLFDNESIWISFDYYSHKSLKQFNINHKLVEEYFDENNKLTIDDLSLKLAISWYNNKNISKYLEYDGLNLGSLLDLEMPSYFFINLKRIIGIIKIIEKENPERIISYSLKNYIDNICKNMKIESVGKYEKKETSNLFYDKMEIPINVVIKTIKIKISRENYFKLKMKLDYIINAIWSVKPNIELLVNSESVLILDFHTIMYENLLKSFQDFPKNVIILNQRKPAIWNLKSLNIIKNSKCKVLTPNDFKNDDICNRITADHNTLRNNLNSLWNEEDTLKQIFSINGETFWDIIKKDFTKIVRERSIESIKKLILLKAMFDKIKVYSILDWAHVASEEKLVSHIANKKKIPIFCLQHGVMALNPSMEKYLPIMPVLPFNNTKMFVWGKSMENYILQHKIKKDDVKIIGSPRHDRFFQQKNKIKNNGTVLIASNTFWHQNFNGNDSYTFENFELSLKKILMILKSTSNKKPIIKLHPAEYFDIKPLIKKIDPNIPIYQYEDILPLLTSCDSIISLNYSTILLDGLILNKPTMLVLTEKQNYEQEEMIKNKAIMCVSNLDDLGMALNKLLFDENVRKDLILKGKEFVDNYLSNQGTASKHLVQALLDH